MSEAARLRTAGIAAAGLAALLAAPPAGCYKPNVASGGLRCATLPAKECPDGFSCEGTVCVRTTSGSSGSGGHAGTSGSGGHVGSGGQPGSGGHVGSGGVSGSGGAGTPDAGQPRAIGETCTIANRGQPNQSDDCQTGAVCVDDCAQSVCFGVCSTDADCPGSSCTRKTASGTMICEVAYVSCDPQAPNGPQGCESPTSCYLLSSTPAPAGGDRTVCDCGTGEGGVGAPCMDSRDCFPGLLCPPEGILGGGACRQVCDATNLISGCTLSICYPFGSKWGYCY